MITPTVCIKIGGRVAADETAFAAFADDVAALFGDYLFVLVHGGGADVSRVSRLLSLEPRFEDGIRMTSEEEMDVVDMVLAGKVNKHMVRSLYRKELLPVGISGTDGALVRGESMGGNSRTGKPTEVDPRLVEHLLAARMLPVIAPVAMDKDGLALNINADDVALAVAGSVRAEALVFISDIPGILREGHVITDMTPAEAEEEITSGVITGGMIPKVRASAGALHSGVSRVVIGGYDKHGDLQALLSGESGTTMHRRDQRGE